jgi:hypothetical protein
MNENFDKFYSRMLVSTKAGADILNWLGIGIFVSLVYHLIPAPDCLLSLSHDEIGLQQTYASMCEGRYSARISAMAWIGFSLLRVFFLVSKWEAGPILKSSGLKIEKQNGESVTLGFAARYALLEWLPFHMLSLYILIFGMPINLYGAGKAVTLALAAQLIWLAPVIFKYRGNNISEFLTKGRVVFDSKKMAKVEKIYQGKWRMKFWNAEFYLENIIYVLVAAFFVFTALQVLRPQSINPDYEHVLYADQEPVWENNVYFTIEGLTAPADIKDVYAYGRAKALQNFQDYETLKKLAHLPYVYEIPANLGDLPPIREAQELKFDSKGWKDLSCLFSLSPAKDAECATKQDFQSYIRANKIIWDRFNALPAYSVYRIPPQQLGGAHINYISLGRLKAAQIIELAENGDSERAFLEWDKYWKLYRSMAGAHGTIVFKAIIAITLKDHLKAFEKLLYLHPDLAKNHAEIAEALTPIGNALFRTNHMLADDVSLLEPTFLGFLGNINAVRNDLYDCILSFEKRAQLPVDEYPFGERPKLCRLSDRDLTESMFIYPFTRPGYFMSNMVESLLIGGTLKGEDLIGSMKLQDVYLRMTLLATEILGQDIAADNVPAFIASVPAELQNPLTQKPFEWDAQKKVLFFIKPGSNAKTEFRLNL